MRATAHFRADGFGREITSRSMQPTSESQSVDERSGVLRQRHKDVQHHNLGCVHVAEHSKSCGKDQVDVAVDYRGKSGLSFVRSVSPHQLWFGLIIHSMNSTRRLRNQPEILLVLVG